MAVNQDAIDIRAGIAQKAAARAREHKFFLTAAILFPVIVIVGFSKNYYLRPFFPEMGPMYSDLVRLHAGICPRGCCCLPRRHGSFPQKG